MLQEERVYVLDLKRSICGNGSYGDLVICEYDRNAEHVMLDCDSYAIVFLGRKAASTMFLYYTLRSHQIL